MIDPWPNCFFDLLHREVERFRLFFRLHGRIERLG
jgi:hypothetical protein